MAQDEAYMLGRDDRESRRLNLQHELLLGLTDGHLIHPSIPRDNLKAVADIGTGTGVWLKDLAGTLESETKSQLFGFDISAQQFPHETPSDTHFIVHDVKQKFASDYQEKFDLVHIRLLSYAICRQDLETVVDNVLDILRPGGFLQWQEFDAIDVCAVPPTPKARKLISSVVGERIARGLPQAIVTPLVKALHSRRVQVETGLVNPVSWSEDRVRILHLLTIPTKGHTSRFVADSKHTVWMTGAVQMLQAGVTRREKVLAESLPPNEVARYSEEIEELAQLIDAVENNRDPGSCDWDYELTWIVARKAIVTREDEDWMMAKYPTITK